MFYCGIEMVVDPNHFLQACQIYAYSIPVMLQACKHRLDVFAWTDVFVAVICL